MLSSEISYSKLYDVHCLLYFFQPRWFHELYDESSKQPAENTHLVGQVGQPLNSPADIESEDTNEDGDGVRTESRLIWKQEEDGRVVLF
jgi:hypothetical protein